MNMKILDIKYLILLLFVLCSLFFVVVPVFSATPPAAPSFQNAAGEATTAATGAGVSTAAPESYVANIVNVALSLVGVIFLILMVYGGYLWMIAKGDEQEVTKAKGVITMAVIGMAVVIMAYAFSKFVVDRLIGAA